MQRFWEHKSLAEMSREEWESVCDGCARCCLKKLEDEDTGEVVYTAVVCQYLDTEQRRCGVYPERHARVPDCIEFGASDVEAMHWLPTTCAYRRLAEGRGLADWHPLVVRANADARLAGAGRDRDSVLEAGIAVTGRTVSELGVPDELLESYVIRWVET